MNQQLVAQILTGNSDEIEDLKLNLPILEGFIELIRRLDALPETSKRFYEASRSLYQSTCTARPITELETLLAKYFGPPVKPAGKTLPRKLLKNPSVKYLGGIQKDQSLFRLPLSTGEFYGALWPWHRNKAKIEIHLGYCSDWITDEHYQQLETLVKRSLSHSTFQQMEAQVGGQIHGIGIHSFLQMAKLERSTLTLRITSAGRIGQLHLAEGRLIGAETSDLKGRQAACSIIGWEDTTIQIAPADPSRSDDINQPLMQVLMEALRIKDEINGDSGAPPTPPKHKVRRPKPDAVKPAKRLVRLERPPEPRPRGRSIRILTILAVVLGATVILGSGAVLGLYVMQQRATSDRYAQLRAQAERTDSLEEKLQLLDRYLQANPQSPRAAEIQSEIDQVRNRIEDRDFDQTVLQVSSLQVNENYEQMALAIYTDFLDRYPDSRHTGRINTAIGEIKNLLDKYYYDELRRAARLDYNQRLAVYRQHLERFPEGRYREDVNILIQEMAEQYLNHLLREDAQCDQTQRWEPCIQRYRVFMANHEGLALGAEAHRRMSALKDRQDLARLRKIRDAGATEYQRAVQAYQDYLQANPDSTQKQTIEEELDVLRVDWQTQRQWAAVRQYVTNPANDFFERIQRLERYLRDHSSSRYAGEARDLMNQMESRRQEALRQRQREARQQEERAGIQREQERLAQQQRRAQQLQNQMEQLLSGSTRYRTNGDGTATDMSTGLTWTLLDSHQALGACVDYPSARQYVHGLKTGGYGNWRIPTANELASIYKQGPYFPASDAQWYWTSEAYARGYHEVADIVTATPESVFVREHRSQDACGAVRAVRL